MNFRGLKHLFVSLTILFSASAAFAETFVEFIILDMVWPEHKWGHVSLRVKTEKKDLVFDFGRYGKMWGFFNTEGAPVLRVWKNANAKHTKYQKEGNPNIHFVRFPATEKQAADVLAFYDRLIAGKKAYRSDGSTQWYDLGSPAFHSLNNNCTTQAITAFQAGFPEYRVNNPAYAVADGLYWWARTEATKMDYNSDYKRWSYIWWPKDLLNSLQDQFTLRGLASETIL